MIFLPCTSCYWLCFDVGELHFRSCPCSELLRAKIWLATVTALQTLCVHHPRVTLHRLYDIMLSVSGGFRGGCDPQRGSDTAGRRPGERNTTQSTAKVTHLHSHTHCHTARGYSAGWHKDSQHWTSWLPLTVCSHGKGQAAACHSRRVQYGNRGGAKSPKGEIGWLDEGERERGWITLSVASSCSVNYFLYCVFFVALTLQSVFTGSVTVSLPPQNTPVKHTGDLCKVTKACSD